MQGHRRTGVQPPLNGSPSCVCTPALDVATAASSNGGCACASRFRFRASPAGNVPARPNGRYDATLSLPAVSGSASRFVTLWDLFGPSIFSTNTGFSGISDLAGSAPEADALYQTELRPRGARPPRRLVRRRPFKDATLVAELHERAGHWPVSQLQSARAASGRCQRARSDQEHTARVPAGREMANRRCPWSRPARRLGGRGSHRRRSHLLLGGGAVPLHGLRFHDGRS